MPVRRASRDFARRDTCSHTVLLSLVAKAAQVARITFTLRPARARRDLLAFV